MAISDYLKDLRAAVGHRLILLPVVGGIVRDDAGRILLQHRRDNGLWDLPGGAVDPGEEPAQALVREVFEETGLHVVPEAIVGVVGGRDGFRHTYPNGDEVESTIVLFSCRVVGGTLAAQDDESVALRFFEPDALPELFSAFPPEVFRPEAAQKPYFNWQEGWLRTAPITQSETD